MQAALPQQSLKIERFSSGCRKVIGFELTTLRDWLKNPRLSFVQSEVKAKPIVTPLHVFSRASRASSFDWLTVMSVFSVIG